MDKAIRKALGTLFQHSGPMLRLGKGGYGEGFADEITNHLKNRPFLKIRIAESARAVDLEAELESHPEVGYQLRQGHTILVVRQGKDPIRVARENPAP